MNPSVPKPGDRQSELDAPPRPELRWLRCCLAFFLLSCALHFPGEGHAFTLDDTPSRVLFGIALASGGTAFLIGLRHLLVRPGAFMILLWFGALALLATVGILGGHPTNAILDSLVAPLFLGLGIITTHVAACAGMRAAEAIRYFLAAVGVSLLWKIGIGSFAQGLEVVVSNPGPWSAGTGFLVAWAACALLLRRSHSRGSLILTGLAAAAVVFGIVRGLSFPFLLPAAGAAICLVLGARWRFFPATGRRLPLFAPAAVFLVLGLIQFALNGVAVSLPQLLTPADLIPVVTATGMMIFAMTLSLRSAWRNAETVMGRWARDAHLMFLPVLAMLCLAGECLFRNPFNEPLTLVLFGFFAAMPQFFFNRAFYLRHRENEAAITPQLILSEEDMPATWKGAFPSEA